LVLILAHSGAPAGGHAIPFRPHHKPGFNASQPSPLNPTLVISRTGSMAWLLQTLGLGAAGSPFETLEEIPSKRSWHWKHYKGRRREGGGAVSIFRVKVAELGDQAPLAKRAFTKTKTMRHPHVLNIIEGLETETELEVVTESVTPVLTWLEEQVEGVEIEQRDACVVWGIRCILEALNFIHSQGMIHGLICPESIFVTHAGDFKLGSLDLLCSLNNSEDFSFFKLAEKQLSVLSGGSHFRSPERCNGEWEKVRGAQFAASDVWSLGQTILALFEGGGVPGELARAQKKMVSAPMVARPKISRLLGSDVFLQSPYVAAMAFIEELSLKGHPEMVDFFKQLTHPMRCMPTATRVYKLLPALKSGIERSIGPDKRPEDCREVSVQSSVLSSM
jgi:SCY1-like protein 1